MLEQNIITSLVELTRQRDQIAIRNKLLSSLIEITDAAWLVLCRQEEKDGQKQIQVMDRIPNPSSDKAIKHFPKELFGKMDEFDKCVTTNNPVWVQDMDIYEAIIFYVPGDERYQDFVVLFDQTVHGRSERMVLSILDLYDNFLTLVIENTQDPLTRLYNRGAFDIDLPSILIKMNERSERRVKPRPGQKSNYLAMIDLDHFKRVNDNFGHLYGDEVLLIFSSVLREIMGDRDQIYRYGGEEFALIVTQINAQDMRQLMEELRAAVESYDFPQVGKVTASIGVAELKLNSLPSTLLDFADQALYFSKEQGRNTVSFYDDMIKNKPKEAVEEEDVFF